MNCSRARIRVCCVSALLGAAYLDKALKRELLSVERAAQLVERVFDRAVFGHQLHEPGSAGCGAYALVLDDARRGQHRVDVGLLPRAQLNRALVCGGYCRVDTLCGSRAHVAHSTQSHHLVGDGGAAAL